MEKSGKWGLPILGVVIMAGVLAAREESEHLDSLDVPRMTCDEIAEEVERLQRCFRREFNWDYPCPDSILDPRVRELYSADSNCRKTP